MQYLREGKLIIRTPSYEFLTNVSLDAPRVAWPIYAVTVSKLIENEWVELASFRAREGQYVLTPKGRAETRRLCNCKAKSRGVRDLMGFTLLSGVDPVTTDPKIDWKKERLLCLKCWRVAQCEGKFFKHPHGANRYAWGVGPICQRHVENPNKQ
jgi:hypothetical protein